jgi:hypothetical protein
MAGGSSAQFTRDLEALARKIVGDGKDRFAIELARSAAEADLSLPGCGTSRLI